MRDLEAAAREHNKWAQHYIPHLVLPMQEWAESPVGILTWAVCLLEDLMGARVEAEEWGTPMACKRRWVAHARYQEVQATQLHHGPIEREAWFRVWTCRGNVLTPIIVINDAAELQCTGEVMMSNLPSTWSDNTVCGLVSSPTQAQG